MNDLTSQISHKHYTLFYILSCILVVSILGAFYLEKMTLITLPIILIGGLMTLINFRTLYYILIFFIPFSIEVYLNGNTFIELPTEPLMVVFLFIVIYRPFVSKKWDITFNLNPITLLIFAQLIWLIPTCFISTDWVLSFKYLLSKNWHVATFMFCTGLTLLHFKDVKSLFWIIYSSLLVTTIIITIRYAGYGFAFEHMNSPLKPFFRNHVIYSTFVSAFLPFVWYARNWYEKGSTKRKTLNYSVLFFLFCILTAYTRASWISIPIAIFAMFIIKWRLIKPALIITGLGLALTIGWLINNNKYIDFAPQFEKTIYHQGNIEGHLSSTYNGTDASSMERIYRWVAAKNMISHRPWLGFGTNCFYDNYRHYKVNSFKTYSSINTERSTTHNYFLMVFAEQGIIGFLLFTALLIVSFILGQKYYHLSKNKEHKETIMAALLSLIIIIFHLFLNDLIETNNIGALFYIDLALIVRIISWENPKTRYLHKIKFSRLNKNKISK